MCSFKLWFIHSILLSSIVLMDVVFDVETKTLTLGELTKFHF